MERKANDSRDEVLEYVERLRTANVRVTHLHSPDMGHNAAAGPGGGVRSFLLRCSQTASQGKLLDVRTSITPVRRLLGDFFDRWLRYRADDGTDGFFSGTAFELCRRLTHPAFERFAKGYLGSWRRAVKTRV